jgi:hypothetical protein
MYTWVYFQVQVQVQAKTSQAKLGSVGSLRGRPLPTSVVEEDV